MFEVGDYDDDGNFTFGQGGNQGARGNDKGGYFCKDPARHSTSGRSNLPPSLTLPVKRAAGLTRPRAAALSSPLSPT